MHSHHHHPGWARWRFRDHEHVRLFSSISSISGTGKECDLMTVWEKVSIYSVWKGVACSESLLAHVHAQRRHHLGCWQMSPGGSPLPWVVIPRPQPAEGGMPSHPPLQCKVQHPDTAHKKSVLNFGGPEVWVHTPFCWLGWAPGPLGASGGGGTSVSTLRKQVNWHMLTRC